ncbi:MAG: YggS family pyridoxal phosphate-dependent enzyme [Pseudomonadota bacterium]
MTTIASNLQAVRAAVAIAAQNSARDAGQVKLLAVSKTFPPDAIREAYQAGQHCFAENYLQEALDKMVLLQDLAIEWHFIGPIQSNKTRLIAEHFNWVHSVDRFKIAERLSAQRPAHLPPLNICLQVNISNEASKSGVPPGELSGLAQAVAKLPGVTLRGLMAIPAPVDDAVLQRQSFARLRMLREDLVQQGVCLDTLSMGMSGDFAAAIAEGATMIRVGSAIFGKRIYR